MKRIVTVVLALALVLCIAPKASAASLTKSQQKKINTIYKVVGNEKNYKKYKVLPSVCMAFSMVESGVGQACRPNNLWGLGGGRYSYSSLESGIKAFMQCINKSYYTRYGATKTTSWYEQTKRIIRGGYCQPAGAYVAKVKSIMKNYHFNEYDKKMFKKIKQAEKKRKAAKLKKKQEAEARRIELEKKRETRRLIALLSTIRGFSNSVGFSPVAQDTSNNITSIIAK